MELSHPAAGSGLSRWQSGLGRAVLRRFGLSVPNPVAVRYAWANNPADANRFNKAGLPASLFRTDAWSAPATTQK